MIMGAYCVGRVNNMLPWKITNGVCHMIMGAYCVGKVHNMLPWWYYDNGRMLCR